MPAKIYPFPTIEDQEVIRTAVKVFLTTQTGVARNRMLRTIRAVLDHYRISRFGFSDYIVETTRMPGLCTVKARSFVSGQTCPWCGEVLYGLRSKVRILNIQERRNYDLVTYGCRCGKVFAKYEYPE
ncbi:MAG TPA: hypothetical protein DCM26_00210 [Desulfotomaculum sp.]|jgi:hypothetical protein|nr:hypothetical protein [Desulfotomaculum sp.]